MMGDDRPTLVCPLCGRGARKYRLVARIRKGFDGPFRIFRCTAHGVEFADSGLGSAGGGAPQGVLDELFGPMGDDIAHRYTIFMDLIERMTKPPGRLHDVGCGNGQPLVEAQRRGWAVQGNDLVESVEPPLEARGIACFIGG